MPHQDMLKWYLSHAPRCWRLVRVVTNLVRLRKFVADFTRLVDDSGGNEATLIAAGKGLLGALIRSDDWLPETFACGDPLRYRQYLLHCDALERFSVVSFVW